MKSRQVAAALVAVLACAACSASQSELRLGARAVAVDLAFSDPALAKPVAPEVIIRIIPAPAQVTSGQATVQQVALPPGSQPATPPLAAPTRACPKAPAGAAPADVAPIGIKAPPRPGTYARHNTGTFGISAGALNLLLPFPAETTDVLSVPREVAPAGPLDPAGPGGEGAAQPGSGVFEWTVVQTITPSFGSRTTYRLTPDAIAIVRRVTVSSGGEEVFEPSPPVNLVVLNQGVGYSWRSAGVDKTRRTTLEIEGRIDSNQAVDVCGELVDSYRVVTTETFVNLVTGETSGTDTNNNNIYNVATQLGGLLVRSELHYTQQTRDPKSGTPVVISCDYTTTQNKVRPKP